MLFKAAGAILSLLKFIQQLATINNRDFVPTADPSKGTKLLHCKNSIPEIASTKWLKSRLPDNLALGCPVSQIVSSLSLFGTIELIYNSKTTLEARVNLMHVINTTVSVPSRTI